MSAPDDKAEGLNPLAERASGPESDFVAMKRYQWCDIDQDQATDGPLADEWFYVSAAADRVIAREKAGWAEAFRLAVFHQERADKAEAALASRDAEIAEAREIMLRAGSWFQIQEVAHPRLSHKARAIWLSMQRWLTPSNVPAEPSGGEK